MWEAVQLCGAQRIDHGVRICEDIEDFWGDRPRLGRFAAFVRDQRIPLEVCPTSNLQTGVAKSFDRHPVGRLAELGFNVTIHCDNRLMGGTSLSEEFAKLSETFGWGLSEVEAVTVAAMRAAFLHHDEREALVEGLIRGLMLMDIGIIAFTAVFVFHLITLPVEFDASNRAIKQMRGLNLVSAEDLAGSKKVLKAAALTYVAAATVALANLLRVLALRGRN